MILYRLFWVTNACLTPNHFDDDDDDDDDEYRRRTRRKKVGGNKGRGVFVTLISL